LLVLSSVASRRFASPVLLSLLLVLSASRSAVGATLTLVPDSFWYAPGQTITITLVGDSQGATDNTLFAAIPVDFDVLVDPHVERFMPPPQAGKDPWLVGASAPGAAVCPYQANRCMLLNAIYPVVGQVAGVDPANEPFTYAVFTATAGLPGVYDIDFVVTPTTQRVDFFGLTSAPGITITIVPEPGTAGLLAVGLLGLCVARVGSRMQGR
jgi:hypothetical protein